MCVLNFFIFQLIDRILNHKILVFGGIDPFGYHSQHQHQQHNQQQQLHEQQRKLHQKQLQLQKQRQQYYHQQLLLQRKRVSSIDGSVMNTTAQPGSIASKHSQIANKFENFGDHVLFYDTGSMQWRLLSHIPFGSRHHHAVVVCNGLIYVIGGTRTEFSSSKKSVCIIKKKVNEVY